MFHNHFGVSQRVGITDSSYSSDPFSQNQVLRHHLQTIKTPQQHVCRCFMLFFLFWPQLYFFLLHIVRSGNTVNRGAWLPFSPWGCAVPLRTKHVLCDWELFFFCESQATPFQGALTVFCLLFCPPSPKRFDRLTITLTLSPGLSNWAGLSHTRRLLVIQLARSTADLFLLYPSVHLILPPSSSP